MEERRLNAPLDTRAALCALLPHTGRMCLLDRVLRFDDTEIECETRSHRERDNPLRLDDTLPAVCGVEYVAQAMGIHGRIAADDTSKPRAGYLASLRDLALHVERLDDIAGPLTVRARRVADSGDSVMCEFSMHAGARLLLTGRATLLLEVR